jgi:hypothetical protein
MTQKKLKTSKLQNIKKKTFKVHKKKGKYSFFPPVKLHTKKLKTPKMIRKKLKTLKVQKPSKFTRRKAKTFSLNVVTQIGATTSVMHA